jgi:hypothetical protein
MPVRYILKRGGVKHPVGYSLLLLALSMIVCMIASVTISLRGAERAVHNSEIKQCESLRSDVAAYRDSATLSETGRKQMESKERLLERWQCPNPPIKE